MPKLIYNNTNTFPLNYFYNAVYYSLMRIPHSSSDFKITQVVGIGGIKIYKEIQIKIYGWTRN